jgi:3-oxoacyl-[acyl-carrier-protein] synthase II
MDNGLFQKSRVAVTGLGLITPLGHNVTDTWAAILAGKSGIGPFKQIEKREHLTGGLCEVKDFNPADYLGRRMARRRDRYQQFATIAARQAMQQAALPISDSNRERIGVNIGTGVGGIQTLVEQEHVVIEKGLRRVSPFAITMIMPNGAAGMLAGGTEAIITHVAVGGFERAGATSSKSSHAPQPFDKNRDGLIVGEGAGMLVLENLKRAQARGAQILGEIVGYGQTTDAHHITAPAEGGLGAARAMRMALEDAGIQAKDVDYISAHGTATPLNDSSETAAIKQALGEYAYEVGISSTKSMTGHIMGATGAIESVFCILAIRDQVMPPTINYETPDPACDLDYVPNEARAARVGVCLNNAFGFGGHNAVLVFKEFEG